MAIPLDFVLDELAGLDPSPGADVRQFGKIDEVLTNTAAS